MYKIFHFLNPSAPKSLLKFDKNVKLYRVEKIDTGR